MTFGEKLLEHRKLNGLSAEELAITCGVSRSYITLIETGRRMPAPKVLPRIAEAFKLKTHIVLNWYLEEKIQKVHQELALPSQS